jgi:vacuolar-type H+-ATPase subunit F/Vma7
MSRLIVIPDGDTRLGFELAGVEVVRVDDQEMARARLVELMTDPTAGLIIVSQHILDHLDDATRRRVDAQIKPVVVGLPTGGPVAGFADRRAYLSALLRRAVGFDLEFGGNGGDGSLS